jgi:large subunit ribosomal protein L24
MRKIRKGDEVFINKGKEKGKRGKVLRVVDKGMRVVIERLNMVKKHKRATERYIHSGITTKEAPVHISNISLVNRKTQKPVKVKIKITGTGKEMKKMRVAAKTGDVLD